MSKTKIIKTDAQAVEYLPDALEIEQSRLPWYGHVGVLWIFLIVASIIIWASLGEVDVIVRAQGKVVSTSGDIVMKPLESSIIKSIEVKKGDIVEAGQVLITFDPAINLAENERLTREIEALEAEFSRYEAEFTHKEYLPPDNRNGSWQVAIFRQRNNYYKEKINFYASNHKRLEAARQSTEESYRKYREILDSMNKIEQMYTELQKDNVVSTKEYLEVTMNRMQNEAEVDRLRNQKIEYEHQLLSLDAERNTFIAEWQDSISEKLVVLSRELDNNRKQLSKVQSRVSYVNLCAPCKAVVLDMASFPIGSAVGEAEAIITLVPLDSPLQIEAEIRPQDIARVHVGSKTRIKLSAFPFQRHGTLEGAIRLISGNTFTRSSNLPAQQSASLSYYRAESTYSGQLRNVVDNFMLIPGMEAEVEIKSGKRRIIDYLIHPLIKGLDEAFKEP